MKIDDVVRKELNSFELSELTRVLETLEQYELYSTGLNRINGGYADAKAYDINEPYENDEGDLDINIELESGEAEVGRRTSTKIEYTISRKILGDHNLNIKQKLHAIKEI